MKTIIAGSRTFADYVMLHRECMQHPITEVVSGGAPGADRLGERWAEARALPVTKFPADRSKHGRKAGPIRNEKMARYAEALVAFWDGESKGTKNMIDLALKYGLKVNVVQFEAPPAPKPKRRVGIIKVAKEAA